MILFTDDSGLITGFQVFPNHTGRQHVVANVTATQAKKMVGVTNSSELDYVSRAVERAESVHMKKKADEQAEALRAGLKSGRDAALNALVYDFGDGRIMQTRPQDEANIVAAIELMDSEGLVSVDWVMEDNTKHAVTSDELREALRSGRLKGLAIWNDYNP